MFSSKIYKQFQQQGPNFAVFAENFGLYYGSGMQIGVDKVGVKWGNGVESELSVLFYLLLCYVALP